MRKNTKEVFEAWRNNTAKGKRGKSISTDGTVIFSYTTKILFPEVNSHSYVLNIMKYSNTTTRQQSDLKVYLLQANIPYREVKL